MSAAPRPLSLARFEDVEFLRAHPDVLAEAEAVLGARPGDAGGVEGGSPPLYLSETDNWLAPPRENAQPSLLPPRAVIPAALPGPASGKEIAEFERESVEDSPARPLPLGWLHALPEPVVGENGDVVRLGDGAGLNQHQALALAHLGLVAKANRLASCGQLGQRVECTRGHPFFERFRCGLRYCRFCGPANFQALFEKHIGLELLAKPGRSRVVAILDFTLRNTGVMPGPETIRRMNRAIRRVMHRLLGKRRDWGYLWCDEFGFDSENLHAHGVYFGPFIPQAKLSEEWLAETGDSKVVWIKQVSSFRRGLIHALKYTSKMPSADPKRLAQLEAAFHRVRRVHALGIFDAPVICECGHRSRRHVAFYKGKRVVGHGACKVKGCGCSKFSADEEKFTTMVAEARCPWCGEPVLAAGGYCSVAELEAAGLSELKQVRAELRRRAALMFGGP